MGSVVCYPFRFWEDGLASADTRLENGKMWQRLWTKKNGKPCYISMKLKFGVDLCFIIMYSFNKC